MERNDEERLRQILLNNAWFMAILEIVQEVHLWFEHYFGYAVEPLTSIEDAVSTWPETATCVAAYLSSDGRLEIIAPHN